MRQLALARSPAHVPMANKQIFRSTFLFCATVSIYIYVYAQMHLQENKEKDSERRIAHCDKDQATGMDMYAQSDLKGRPWQSSDAAAVYHAVCGNSGSGHPEGGCCVRGPMPTHLPDGMALHELQRQSRFIHRSSLERRF